jgi:ribosomal protein S18 acetylase RimI-like enzyme
MKEKDVSVNQNVFVKQAALDDIKSMSSLMAASWKSAYRGIVNDSYLDMLRDDHWVSNLTVGIKDESLFAFALEENGHMIGAAILNKTSESDTIELTSIYLLPGQIGRGYGALFYQGIETEIKSRGYKTCVLDVLENNDRAIRFYTKHGFVDEGNNIMVMLGGQEYVCKVMKKSISE